MLWLEVSNFSYKKVVLAKELKQNTMILMAKSAVKSHCALLLVPCWLKQYSAAYKVLALKWENKHHSHFASIYINTGCVCIEGEETNICWTEKSLK